jgi:hypothetical protein
MLIHSFSLLTFTRAYNPSLATFHSLSPLNHLSPPLTTSHLLTTSNHLSPLTTSHHLSPLNDLSPPLHHVLPPLHHYTISTHSDSPMPSRQKGGLRALELMLPSQPSPSPSPSPSPPTPNTKEEAQQMQSERRGLNPPSLKNPNAIHKQHPSPSLHRISSFFPRGESPCNSPMQTGIFEIPRESGLGLELGFSNSPNRGVNHRLTQSEMSPITFDAEVMRIQMIKAIAVLLAPTQMSGREAILRLNVHTAKVLLVDGAKLMQRGAHRL